MKPSEYLLRRALADDLFVITLDEIEAIEKLEAKAVLWDKISALPDGFLIGTYGDKWCINDFHDGDIWGNTLEEALNQIPEAST